MQSAALTYVLREVPGIEAFKIVQESLALTRLMLVTAASFDRGRAAEIVAGFRRRLGPSVAVEVEFVDHIPAEKSGKYRYIISHVADSAGAAKATAVQPERVA
jgi:phenylacetate-CoA ligase